MPSDIAVGATSALPLNPVLSKKPSYLIVLDNTSGKTKTQEEFITIDKPELLNGFVQAKGFFVDKSEKNAIKNFSELLTKIDREFIVEMLFPWHKICSIRNLIFKSK